jgi:hypothetical protein
MSTHLEYLLDVARKYRAEHGFPDDERDQQIRSFAYGNTRLENQDITMSDIDEAVDSLRAEREHSTVCT